MTAWSASSLAWEPIAAWIASSSIPIARSVAAVADISSASAEGLAARRLMGCARLPAAIACAKSCALSVRAVLSLSATLRRCMLCCQQVRYMAWHSSIVLDEPEWHASSLAAQSSPPLLLASPSFSL